MYISSYEYDEFKNPRKIVSSNKIEFEGRVVFKVIVDTPIFGQDYGLGGAYISELYLVGRFEELKELNSFPFEVHVFIPKSDQFNSINSLSQLQNIGWASVYDNERDAAEHKI